MASFSAKGISGSIQTKAIDAGQNFLTGQITTLFAASGMEVTGSTIYNLADSIQNSVSAKVEEAQNGAMQLVSSAGAGLGSAFGTVVGVGNSLASTITTMSDVAQEMLTDIATDTVNKVTNETNKIVSGASTYFTQRLSYYAKSMLEEEIANMQSKYLTNTDEKQNEEVKEKKETWMKKATEKVGSMVTKAKKGVQDGIDALNKGVDEVAKMQLEGPQWVSNQMNSLQSSITKSIDDFIEDNVKDIQEKRDAELDKIAATIAKNTVKPTIDAANKKLDKLWNDCNTSKSKVAQKAKTLIQKAKFKLAALTGVSPI